MRINKVVATVTDTPGAEGVEYVPEFKKFYTSNAGDNTIGVVDMRQMKVVKKLRGEGERNQKQARREVSKDHRPDKSNVASQPCCSKV
ncbi:MAG: hypothetical protein JO159_15880 [Acidobacteria bacterium]|nr:hypothetical protein [Acidobacteriota bacterium]